MTSTGATDVFPGASAAVVRQWLRRRRAARTRQGVRDALYRLYLFVLFIGIPGAYIAAQAIEDNAERLGPAAAAALRVDLAGWLPAIFLLVCLAGLRLAVWRGPVILSEADVRWLLSGPAPRSEFTRPQLLRGIAIWAGLGAAAGLLLWVALLAVLSAPAMSPLLACVGSGLLLGAVTVAAAWAVECRPALARAVLRVTLPIVLIAVALAVTTSVPAVATVARWSGPWGWATAPILAASGAESPGWQLAAVLLAASAIGGVAWSLVTAGAVPIEQLRRRASSAQAMTASVFWSDAGAINAARRQAVMTLVGRRVRIIPMVRRRRLTVPWVGVAVLARGPWLWARALILLTLAAGTAVAATQVSATAFSGTVVLFSMSGAAAYFAATALVEPIRIEATQRFAIRFLPWPERTVLLTHLLVPALILAVLGSVIAAIAALLVGAGHAAWAAAAGATLLAPGLTIAAAYAALKPPPDTMLLLAGEAGMALWISQALGGLQRSWVITLPAAILAAGALGAGRGPAAALLLAGGWAVLSANVGLAVFRWWLTKRY